MESSETINKTCLICKLIKKNQNLLLEEINVRVVVMKKLEMIILI